MKKIATLFVAIGFAWVGFWLHLMDEEMSEQLQPAMDDGFEKYPPKRK